MRVLAWTKARVRDRENLRFERTRMFGRARRLFLAMGSQFHAHGLIDEPRDVFFLTVARSAGRDRRLRDRAPTSQGLVALRKAEMAAAAQRARSARAAERHRRRHRPQLRSAPRSAPDAGDERVRTATGCSAGTVPRPRPRGARSRATKRLQRGEILVARHTDPGWIALFANASAIVVERGSLLSHSAIVARELGIPCVVGLKGAMDWIATGEQIEVDGATGTVRKLDG